MKLMISGATTTVEELLPNQDVAPYLGAMVTPNTSNSISRVCGWNIPWCIDNACFDESKFDPARFVALMYKAGKAETKPMFAAVPDVVHLTADGPVGDHEATLKRFFEWYDTLAVFNVPLAFVAQDGLSDLGDVPWDRIDAVFIGGGDWFKDEMTMHIAEACREMGKWCHLGRVNGRARLRLALHNGVDSVDGSSLSKYAKAWIPKFAADCKALEQEVCWLGLHNQNTERELAGAN